MRSRRRRSFVLLAVAAALLGAGGAAPCRPRQDARPAATGESLFGSYDLRPGASGVQARYEVVGLLPRWAPDPRSDGPRDRRPVLLRPDGLRPGLHRLSRRPGRQPRLPGLPGRGRRQPDPGLPDQGGGLLPVRPRRARTRPRPEPPRTSTRPAGRERDGHVPGDRRQPGDQGRERVVRFAERHRGRQGGGPDPRGGQRRLPPRRRHHDRLAGHGSRRRARRHHRHVQRRHPRHRREVPRPGRVADQGRPRARQGPGCDRGRPPRWAPSLPPVLDPLKQLTAPVQALLSQVLNQAVPSLNSVLSGAGIDLQLLGGGKVESDSGAAGYASSGLALTLSYKGKEQAALASLIDSIPAELRPSVGPLPNPIAFLTENHITGLTFGRGTVSVGQRTVRHGDGLPPPMAPPTPGSRASMCPSAAPPTSARRSPTCPPGPGRRLGPGPRGDASAVASGAIPGRPAHRCSSWPRPSSGWPPPAWPTTSWPLYPPPARRGSTSPIATEATVMSQRTRPLSAAPAGDARRPRGCSTSWRALDHDLDAGAPPRPRPRAGSPPAYGAPHVGSASTLLSSASSSCSRGSWRPRPGGGGARLVGSVPHARTPSSRRRT